jgi:hypothetical protein
MEMIGTNERMDDWIAWNIHENFRETQWHDDDALNLRTAKGTARHTANTNPPEERIITSD